MNTRDDPPIERWLNEMHLQAPSRELDEAVERQLNSDVRIAHRPKNRRFSGSALVATAALCTSIG